MSHKFISIVIPAFNAQSTIIQTLSSLKHQCVEPYEIIVVDDGSDDDTISVITEFDGDVEVIRQANTGAAGARQTGTLAATGEYVAYLDADDWWLEDRLERLSQAVSNCDVDFLFGDFVRGRIDDKPKDFLPRNSSFFPILATSIREFGRATPVENLYEFEAQDGFSLIAGGVPVFPTTMLVRKSTVMAIGGWDTRFRRCQDFDISLRLSMLYPVHYFDEVQAVVGLHDINSDLDRYLELQWTGDMKVLLAHLNEETLTVKQRSKLAKAVARKHISLGDLYRRTNRTEKARQQYLSSFRQGGARPRALLQWLKSFS